MCGIVGAVAQRDIAGILLAGLQRLEYRGYDSAGLAIIDPHKSEIQRARVLGKVARLVETLEKQPIAGNLGIAHTRWATHGQPSTANAHPHFSNDEIAIVHNGIIENHHELRKKLTQDGYRFESETDTEVVVHLIHQNLKLHSNLQKAIQESVKALEGAYSLGIINVSEPERLYAVRSGSPLVIGVGIGENFIASDPMALLPVTQEFIYLEEGDLAILETQSIQIFDDKGLPVQRKVHVSEASLDQVSKGEFRHYMLKEIFEQPQALSDVMSGYLNHDHIIAQNFGHKAETVFPKIKRVFIVACGTSYHAGLVARHWFESIMGIPCQVEVASENRYRKKVVEPDCLFVALSQSGETADTLAALRQAQADGYESTLAVCNAPESSLVREADLAFMIRAGVEIGVAATKTFSNQLIALMLLATAIGKFQGLDPKIEAKIVKELKHIPSLVQKALQLDETIKLIAQNFINKQSALFLGRGIQFPIALEGALKLKEISYVHSEAYPAGELKHGPLALVDKGMPVVVLADNDELSAKLASNIQEVQARGGQLYVFADENLNWQDSEGVSIINMPISSPILSPLLYNIPLQLLSYHVAVLKGTDVDQPRNLAKSVTVE